MAWGNAINGYEPSRHGPAMPYNYGVQESQAAYQNQQAAMQAEYARRIAAEEENRRVQNSIMLREQARREAATRSKYDFMNRNSNNMTRMFSGMSSGLGSLGNFANMFSGQQPSVSLFDNDGRRMGGSQSPLSGLMPTKSQQTGIYK